MSFLLLSEDAIVGRCRERNERNSGATEGSITHAVHIGFFASIAPRVARALIGESIFSNVEQITRSSPS